MRTSFSLPETVVNKKRKATEQPLETGDDDDSLKKSKWNRAGSIGWQQLLGTAWLERVA